MGFEAAELARWTRFAAKGGIGRCTATCDCVAENADDLMFLKDDEITVLLQLPEKDGHYLGYCEGVVGRFCGTDVVFHSKLKKPVMARRQSVSAASLNGVTSTGSLSSRTKSPTPTNPKARSPSPAAQPPPRRSGEEIPGYEGGYGQQSQSQPQSRSHTPQGPNLSSSSMAESSSQNTLNRPLTAPSAPASTSVSPIPHASSMSRSRSFGFSQHHASSSSSSDFIRPPPSDSAMSFSSLATFATAVESPMHSPSSTVFFQANSRSGSVDARRTNGAYYGTPSPREFHFVQSGEISRVGSGLSSRAMSPLAQPPSSGSTELEDLVASISANASSSDANISSSSPPTPSPPSSPPPPPPAASDPSPSSPKRLNHIPPPLNLYRETSTSSNSSRLSDVSSASNNTSGTTSPLRITKRLPSNPSSPAASGHREMHPLSPLAQQAFKIGGREREEKAESGMPSAVSGTSSSFFTAPTSSVSNNSTSSSSSMTVSVEPPPVFATASPQSSSFSDSSNDPTPPHSSALPSALDASMTTSSEFSTYDDLTRSHPGRFSRFSMGPGFGSLALPAFGSAGAFPPSPLPPPLASGANSRGNKEHIIDPNSSAKPASTSPRPPMPRTGSSATLSGGKTVPLDDATIADTHAQVGIGLSLLQDLVGGMSSDSESGSEYDDDSEDDGLPAGAAGSPGKRKSVVDRDDRRSKYETFAGGKSEVEVEEEAYAAALGRVGMQRGSVAESTMEGLMYGGSEDDHGQEVEFTHQEDVETTAKIQDPNTFAKPTPQGYNPAFLSPTTSPTSPMFSPSPSQYTSPASPVFPHINPNHFPNLVERERRPSLARSAASATSIKSTGTATSWEGAADIYDDYRYSRISSNSAATGQGVGRPSLDSIRGRADSGGAGGSGSINGSANGRLRASAESGSSGSGSLASLSKLATSTLAQVDETESPVDPFQHSATAAKRTTLTMVLQRERRPRDRTMSLESEASIYTQNSRLSTLSRDIAELAGVDVDDESLQSFVPVHQPLSRPTPLSLSPEPTVLSGHSPLLHTDWASPATANGVQTAVPPGTSVEPYTPTPGWVGAEGAPGLGIAVPFAGDAKETGAGGMVSIMGGMASAMRQKLELDRRSPLPTENKQQNIERNGNDTSISSFVSGAGLGGGIVVEDEEELPSKIMTDHGEEFDDEGDTFIDEARLRFVDSPEPADEEVMKEDSSRSIRQRSSESPEPETMLGRLAPLVVANRTPSPGGSKEDEDSTVADSLDDRQRQTPSPMVPSPPPVTTTSPNGPSSNAIEPPPQQLSHLRPQNTLSTPPDGQQRRSLFMPHPNAPKAPAGAAFNIVPGAGVGVGAGLPPGMRSPQAYAGPDQQPPPPPGPYPPNFQGAFRGPPPQRPSLQAVIRMALSTPPRRPPPSIQGRPPTALLGPTIYGRTDVDLANSMGPVLMLFSIDPPPPIAGSKATAPGGAAPPPIGLGYPLASNTSPPLTGGQTLSTPLSIAANPATASTSTPPQPPPRVTSRPSPPPRSMSLQVAGGPSSRSPSPISGLAVNAGTRPNDTSNDNNKATVSNPIARPNFIPKAAGLRPRSRSFSGFNSTSTGDGVGLIASVGKSRASGDTPSTMEVKRSHSSTNLNASGPSSTSSLNPGVKLTPKSSPLRPSPLSLSSTSSNLDAKDSSRSGLKSPALKVLVPPSPLAQSVTMRPPSSASQFQQPLPSPSFPMSAPSSSLPPSPAFGNFGLAQRSSQPQLRQMSSRATLAEASPISVSSSSTGFSGNGRLPPMSRSTLDASGSNNGVSSSDSPFGRAQNQSRTASMQSRAQPDSVSLANQSPTDNRVASPTMGNGSIQRQNSLRAKLSLPNLRRNRSRPDDDTGMGVYERDLRERQMHPLERDDRERDKEMEMLQVQDMEFELVRPNFIQSQAARTSEDSAILGRDGSMDLRPDGSSTISGFLRPDSPAVSVVSSGISGTRSPTNEGPTGTWIPQAHPSSSASFVKLPITESPASMQAHRQRELKWVSLMSSSPAALSRKSKKVKKLLLEGVPSSVRYLVWTYLTDGKGRAVKGVYEQLCRRGEVGRTGQVMADVDRLFGSDNDGTNEGMEHLSGTKGPVIVLLQAYLNMVPDVQYSTGLTKIVGQLLLLSPEEDAFWIFISIMDTHIRPYFSIASPATGSSTPRSTQMEVDAALYSRALEANDAVLAKKLFVDLGVLPGAICQPWLSTLFVGTLPPDYLSRVWDIFLYDGIPFLLRVAVTLTIVSRRSILSCAAGSEQALLGVLARPPPTSLPPTPEAFLAMAMGLKMKDDDIRKQRIKMGEMVKRQTQAQQASVAPGGISLPRS